MTAGDRVNRIGILIAELSRRNAQGETMPSIEQLAAATGVAPEAIKGDIRTLQSLNDSAEAEWFLSLRAYQIENEVMISSSGPFRRPVRPTPDEALALAVGLAAEFDTGATDVVRDLLDPHPTDHAPIALGRCARSIRGVHDLALDAIRHERCLAIRYAGDNHAAPTERTIQPHDVVTAGGKSVIVAWCELRDDWRRFRTDRVLSAEPAPTSFVRRDDVPADMFVAPEQGWDRVRVRFSPRIARWLRERFAEVEDTADGGIIVTYTCANAEWMIREVLQYGDAAEILEPPAYRAMMREAVGG